MGEAKAQITGGLVGCHALCVCQDVQVWPVRVLARALLCGPAYSHSMREDGHV